MEFSAKNLPEGLKLLSQEPEFAPPTQARQMGFSLYAPGLPMGALTHLGGEGRTEVVLRLLGEHPGLKAAWVEERLTAYPPGFVQQGADLQCLLFVQGGEHFAWALTQLVRSQIFSLVVVASPIKSGEAGLELRRLQLVARQAACAVILAAPYEGPGWPLRLRLEAWRDEEGELRLREADPEGARFARGGER